MKKILVLLLLVSSSYSYSETWNCVIENEREIYSKTKHIRQGSDFLLYVDGQYQGTDKIIEENEKEIVLYFETEVESFITIIHKGKNTILTFNSSGKDPNEDLPPGFGSCDSTQ